MNKIFIDNIDLMWYTLVYTKVYRFFEVQYELLL